MKKYFAIWFLVYLAGCSSQIGKNELDEEVKSIALKFQNENDPKYLMKLKELALDQNFESAYWLGSFYIDGIGVKVDESAGLDYLKQSAKGGYPDGVAQLGAFYFIKALEDSKSEEENCKLSVKYITIAVEKYNHIAALNNLALMYKSGICMDQDIDKSIPLFERAALAGDSVAALTLSNIYSEGLTGKVDLDKAAYWKGISSRGDYMEHVKSYERKVSD